jgi:hypothetical protein
MAVLQSASPTREYATFGAAQWVTFPSYAVAANVGVTPSSSLVTPAVLAQLPLPCNSKILAIAAFCSGGINTGIGINVASGSAVGSYATGTITFAGGTNSGSAGTCTITIAGPTAGTSQTIVVAIGATSTVTQSAAAAVAAINAVADSGGPQIFATNSAGVVTIFQLGIPSVLAGLGSAQTYQAVLSAGIATQTVSPTTATAFSGVPTAAQGKSDNSGPAGASGVATAVPPQTAASGQLLFERFHNVPSSVAGANTVFYPGLVAAIGTVEWDIIFPCDRTLALVGIIAGYANAATLQVSVLALPYILDPTQPHSAPWAPKNSTIGCPSTD